MVGDVNMNVNQELFSFINNSPTAFHTVAELSHRLDAAGYQRLYENRDWALTPGGKYYVTRNSSSIIAFRAVDGARGFMIAASHSDSPAFRLKASEALTGAYTRLDVEKYGGMIYYSWLDRPLSLAGRAIVRGEDGVEQKLFNIDKEIAVIPSVAIHLNRGVNDGHKFNPAKDMLPLVAMGGAKGDVTELIAKALGVKREDIVSHDVFLYNREKGREVGINGEFILSPRLDDLECVFASLSGFLAAADAESVPVLAVFDNEEVGSETKQGAASTFLADTLSKIAGKNYSKMLAESFMVSADNAHAKHPNYPELSDAENAPLLNGGIVVKWNANQRYATDGVSAALFKTLADRCGVKIQNYYNRADMLGGSTLGSISDTVVSVPTVDIGLPQLAMHSATETAGREDLEALIKVFIELYSTAIKVDGEKISI